MKIGSQRAGKNVVAHTFIFWHALGPSPSLYIQMSHRGFRKAVLKCECFRSRSCKALTICNTTAQHRHTCSTKYNQVHRVSAVKRSSGYTSQYLKFSICLCQAKFRGLKLAICEKCIHEQWWVSAKLLVWGFIFKFFLSFISNSDLFQLFTQNVQQYFTSDIEAAFKFQGWSFWGVHLSRSFVHIFVSGAFLSIALTWG